MRDFTTCDTVQLNRDGYTRQPNCPPEKEIAIVDALKHFKMIQ